MPWDCNTCGEHVERDARACPSCQVEKSSWTVVPGQTRRLVLGKAKVECLRGRVHEATDAGLPLYDPRALDPTGVARVMPKRMALRLHEGGRRPASFDLLVVRLTPRLTDGEVLLGIDYAARELEEARHPVPEAPYVDVPFLFVAGPEALPAGFGFAGLEVVDVSEETEAGFAPGLEVTALKRPTIELTTEPIEDERPAVLARGKLSGVTFAHDSAFVRPGVAGELKALEALAREHPDAVISLFGHADAVGDALYNKKLSERRAWSVYAFVVDDPDVWEVLYDHPDEDWGMPVLREILTDLGHTGSDQEAMRSFLLPGVDEGPVKNDAAFRKQLFAAYMSEAKRGVDLPAERFLEPGYMGCGEYNLLEQTAGASEANRRVTVFYFDPAQVPSFPCAFADTGPCQQQVALPGERQHAGFGCAFYDELAREPERPLPTVDDEPRVRFYRADGTFIPHAAWTFYGPDGEVLGEADAQGEARLPDVDGRWTITWHDPQVPLFDHAHHYACEVHLGLTPEQADDQAAERRLHNLGYHDHEPLPARAERFQRDYAAPAEAHGLALTPSGALDAPTAEMLRRAHDTCPDDLRAPCPSQEV